MNGLLLCCWVHLVGQLLGDLDEDFGELDESVVAFFGDDLGEVHDDDLEAWSTVGTLRLELLEVEVVCGDEDVADVVHGDLALELFVADLVEVVDEVLVADLQQLEEELEGVLVDVALAVVDVAEEGDDCFVGVVVDLEDLLLGLLHVRGEEQPELLALGREDGC